MEIVYEYSSPSSNSSSPKSYGNGNILRQVPIVISLLSLYRRFFRIFFAKFPYKFLACVLLYVPNFLDICSRNLYANFQLNFLLIFVANSKFLSKFLAHVLRHVSSDIFLSQVRRFSQPSSLRMFWIILFVKLFLDFITEYFFLQVPIVPIPYILFK